MKIWILVFLGAVVAGCSSVPSPEVVPAFRMQHLEDVRFARIEAVRDVLIQPETAAGPAAGAVVGAVAGSGIGGRRDAVIGATLGALAGAMVGKSIEQGTGARAGQELILRLEDGRVQAIVQPVGDERFQVGERVKLIGSRGHWRVVR
jgi:outer membrane lipoprotein SlyB